MICRTMVHDKSTPLILQLVVYICFLIPTVNYFYLFQGYEANNIVLQIDVLPEIVKQVKGRCEIYLDGGVTTGGDVFKAIALGANMVFS